MKLENGQVGVLDKRRCFFWWKHKEYTYRNVGYNLDSGIILYFINYKINHVMNFMMLVFIPGRKLQRVWINRLLLI